MKWAVRTTVLIAMVVWCTGMLTTGCGGSQPTEQTAADQQSEAAPEVAAEQAEPSPTVDRGPIEVPLREPAADEAAGDDQGGTSDEDEGYDESGDEEFGEF